MELNIDKYYVSPTARGGKIVESLRKICEFLDTCEDLNHYYVFINKDYEETFNTLYIRFFNHLHIDKPKFIDSSVIGESVIGTIIDRRTLKGESRLNWRKYWK